MKHWDPQRIAVEQSEMGRTFRERPRDLSPAWPDVASADPSGEVARQYVLNLRSAIGERSVRSVARDAELDEGTVRRVLSGDSWPDLRTISRLDECLGTQLYPT